MARIFSVRFKLAVVTLLIPLVFSVAARQSFAAVGAEHLFETPLARYLFNETREGSLILSRIGRRPKPQYDEVMKALGSPEYKSVRTELEAQLHDLDELIQSHRLARAGHDPQAINALANELTAEEKLIVKQLAARRLKINPEWVDLFQQARNEDSLDLGLRQALETGYADDAQRFLRQEDPFLEPAVRATQAEKATAFRKAKDIVGRMKSCLASQTPKQQQQSRLSYIADDFMISEIMTGLGHPVTLQFANRLYSNLTGQVVSSGEKIVPTSELITDLSITGVTSVVGGFISTKGGNWKQSWMRTWAFGQGRAAFDATWYYLEHQGETQDGMEAGEVALKRLAAGTIWGAGNSPLTVGMRKLFQGVECLAEGGKYETFVMQGMRGVRLARAFGNTILYFELRSHIREL